ncbi:hypothetical protein AQUSIP_04150 [Aquicella siphonis]|uniref:Uncharacterized protein n=1 Tax=Aquicella siphonis TaxID=254247 RepID=A0A5E4PF67_9COXI|nr:Lpg1974 family pore-forming outer membrane protein [Aquicella siphonis]VVC75138.1 hypothetical protein AQUSIP_04150 [Aquicella siphonis]
MKSFFKRSAVSMIVLGMAGASYAAMPNNNASWSPSLSGAFIGVEGLDLRPQNGDLDYVTVFPSTSNGSFYTHAISPSYDWNWRVYGGIKFTENDDLTLSWMQMRTSDTDSISTSGLINGAGYATPRWLSTYPWKNVSGKVTFDLDEAYLVWGHTVYFNNPWSVRFAGGVEYAKLNSKMTVTANPYYDTSDTFGFYSKSDMRGWGPRAEFDMTYHLPYGFALFANANAALLVSTRDISLTAVNELTADEDGGGIDYTNRHVVIPKLGMRLGASYSYVFGQAGAEGVPCRTTTLTVDAGWQAESYIHAIERPDFGTSSVETSPNLVQSSSSSFSTKTSNFGDQGLFVGIKLSTDWM